MLRRPFNREETMPRKYHGRRALLNRKGHQSTAAVVMEIEDTGRWEEGKDGNGHNLAGSWIPNPMYTFQFANCDRSLAFELSFSDAEERRNNLHKIDTMIRALQDFREGVKVEGERYARRRQAHVTDD